MSLAATYIVRYNFDVQKLNDFWFVQVLLVNLIVCAVVFFIIKTYTGIISYTSAQDSFRILLAVIANTGMMFMLKKVSLLFNQGLSIPNSVLIINALICFLLMVTYRVFAKYSFLYIKNLKLDTRRVIIYGVGEAGIAAKRTFDHNCEVNKSIIAFVDDDPRKVGNSILGVKILSSSKLPAMIAESKLDELVFASHNIPPERMNPIIDQCLENNIKILSIPQHHVWQSGKLRLSQIQNFNIEELLNRDAIEIDTTAIQHELNGKHILITGAAGSIGSEIVRQLLRFRTGMIIMCDQCETALHDLHLEICDMHTNANVITFIGDVRDQSRMEHLFETYKPHYVYHAAAYKHVPMMEDNASEAVKTNVGGTKLIADLSVKHAVEKFVMISTDKAVNPSNIMGASKRIAEIYVQSLNRSISNQALHIMDGLGHLSSKPVTRFITTRFGNVLGSNGSVIPRFRQQIEKGGPITVTHPEIRRYFMTILEACRLVLEAGCMGKGGEIFVFNMGNSVKIVDLAKRMIRLAGLIPFQDIKIEFTGLRPGEKLYEELLNNQENTLPTHHEKIMIGKVREYQFSEIESQISNIIRHARSNDDLQVVKCMKLIVEEFKSKNSVYEELDVIPKAM